MAKGQPRKVFGAALCSKISEKTLFGFNSMLICISGQHQGQSSVTGYVAGGSKAVLECEDSQHQGSTGIVKEQDSGNQPQGSHNRSARYTRRPDGKYAKEQAEKNHGANGWNLSLIHI